MLAEFQDGEFVNIKNISYALVSNRGFQYTFICDENIRRGHLDLISKEELQILFEGESYFCKISKNNGDDECVYLNTKAITKVSSKKTENDYKVSIFFINDETPYDIVLSEENKNKLIEKINKIIKESSYNGQTYIDHF